jgi:two-component system chemotaxis response regulator CheB
MTNQNPDAVVIGGSAGALDALNAIFPALPASYPLGIAVVLHVPPGKPSYLSEFFRSKCSLAMKEAEDKEPLRPATVYFAPPDYHLLLERGHYFSLSVDEPVLFSRPAIDVLFESAADAYGPRLTGVLLTGASEDGARGLARIKRSGGTTIVQDPSTASSRTMPEAAVRLGAVDHVLPLQQIGSFLAGLCPPRPDTLESR